MQVGKSSSNGPRYFNARSHYTPPPAPAAFNGKHWQNGGLPSTLAGRLRNKSHQLTLCGPKASLLGRPPSKKSGQGTELDHTFLHPIESSRSPRPPFSSGAALQRARPGGLAPVSPHPTDTIFLKRRQSGTGRGEKTEVSFA